MLTTRGLNFLSLTGLCIAFFSLEIACNKEKQPSENLDIGQHVAELKPKRLQNTPYISALNLEKATYIKHLDSALTLHLALVNPTEKEFEGEVVFSIYHLEELLQEYSTSQSIRIDRFDQPIYLSQHTFPLPQGIDKGYMLEVSLQQKDSVLDSKTIGFDVLSDWKRFPRYGFVSSFDADENHEIFDELSRFHLNGVMFYDWQYSHQQPYQPGLNQWHSLDGKKMITKENITSLIKQAHDKNQKAFNYNLIYGAYDKRRVPHESTYEDFFSWKSDQPNLDWGLYVRNSHNEVAIDTHDERQDWRDWGWMTNRVMLFNPCNPAWQDYIFDKESIAFGNFAFDGWHMDTLGDRTYRGTLVDSDNKPLGPLASCYQSFIESAKTQAFSLEPISDDPVRLNQHSERDRVVFNAVGGPSGGLEEIAKSPVDVIFTELWSDPGTESYSDVIHLIEEYRKKSQKQIVVAGYINRNARDGVSEFLEESVLLAHAAVYSAGGSLFAMGDKGRLTCSPFLSSEKLYLNAETKDKLIQYYDFVTAYETLLRGSFDAATDHNIVTYSKSAKLCKKEAKDCVHTMTKNLSDEITFQLVNFMGQKNAKWSDPDRKASIVPILHNLDFTMLLDSSQKLSSAWIVSPDRNNGLPLPLNFTMSKGSYSGIEGKSVVKFTVPELNIWDLIFFRKAPDES